MTGFDRWAILALLSLQVALTGLVLSALVGARRAVDDAHEALYRLAAGVVVTPRADRSAPPAVPTQWDEEWQVLRDLPFEEAPPPPLLSSEEIQKDWSPQRKATWREIQLRKRTEF